MFIKDNVFVLGRFVPKCQNNDVLVKQSQYTKSTVILMLQIMVTMNIIFVPVKQFLSKMSK